MASYEKRENGTWSVRFRYMNNGNLANKRLSGYRTKKDAEKAYSEYILANDFSPSAIGDKTFGEAYAIYLEYISNRVKQSTVYTYESCYNSRVKPIFEKTLLKDITPLVVLKFQNSLTYSYKYKQKTRALLLAVFKHLVKYYDYPTNPVEKTEGFRKIEPKKEMEIWSKEDFSKFIDSVDNQIYKTLFTLLYFTGLRRGEAMALNWADIDLNKGIVSITKTYTRKIKTSSFSIENTPKTNGSNRTVTIPKELCNMLKELKSVTNGDFVFNGKSPIPETSMNRELQKYIDKTISQGYKLKSISYHGFRHSHASYLLSNGVSIVAVSKRLGHSNVTQTLNTYAHLMKSDEEQILSLLNLGTNLGTEKIR